MYVKLILTILNIVNRPGFPPRGARGPIGMRFPGPMVQPARGPMMGPRGRGTGSYRGGRVSNKGNESSKAEGTEEGERVKKEDNPGKPEDQHDLDDPAIIGASISKDNGTPDGNDETEEPPKNLNSGQGTKGQLALLAFEALASEESRKTRKINDKKEKNKPNASPRRNLLESQRNLRERLIQQLVGGEAECMVCLDKIKPKNATWDCQNCYQVFHIHCIKKWANSQENDDGGWRCPGCQKVWQTIPKSYRCFCRKALDPAHDRRETPHSCGEVCGRALQQGVATSPNENEGKMERINCPHKCLELCHPGPCPPCNAR